MSERLSERERVARELHDGLLQGFQGLMMRFHLATQTMPEGSASRTEMEQALDRADDLLVQSRDSIKDLRCETMLPVSLKEVLSELQGEFSFHTNARPSISERGTPPVFSPSAYEEIYAIAREAIINAFKHSGATIIKVSLIFEVTRFTLLVCDDGNGIPHAALNSRGGSDHWGIAGMYERARNLQAELKITTPQRQGTLVCLIVSARMAYVRTAQ